MIQAGVGGRIINILSTASELAFSGDSAYCASKAAALSITRSMAVELGSFGIEVNGVVPGWVDTQMGQDYHQDRDVADHELSRTPLGRFGHPDDVAEAVSWLATCSRWVTGQILYVDGGFMATGGPPPGALRSPGDSRAEE
jgi:gluconate 5-dehydrogenase